MQSSCHVWLNTEYSWWNAYRYSITFLWNFCTEDIPKGPLAVPTLLWFLHFHMTQVYQHHFHQGLFHYHLILLSSSWQAWNFQSAVMDLSMNALTMTYPTNLRYLSSSSHTFTVEIAHLNTLYSQYSGPKSFFTRWFVLATLFCTDCSIQVRPSVYKIVFIYRLIIKNGWHITNHVSKPRVPI